MKKQTTTIPEPQSTYAPLTEAQRKAIERCFEGGNVERTKFEMSTEKDGYHIKVSKMYERAQFVDGLSSLQGFHKIAAILGVTNGDEVDSWSEGGCETCDWGSNYGYELRFW